MRVLSLEKDFPEVSVFALQKDFPEVRVLSLQKDSRSESSCLTKQKRSTEGCSKFSSPETRQVQERLVSTLEQMQVPMWDRTRCPEE